ncbi:terminase [Caldimonas sp. KR1-144]|uniref:terminase n=1 Tax=Caldimonas sp. KR1-144 TaxID=3400911 RepID=UPI003C00AEEA
MATRKAPARKKAPPAKKVGRPTKFKPDFLRQVYELALLGLTDEEMAPVIGVSVATFNTYKRQHPEFLESLTRGKVIADGQVAASLHHRARGYSHEEIVITSYQGEITKTRVTRHYPPDTQAAGIWLWNRQPTRWRRQPDSTDGNDDAPPPVKVVVEVKSARRRSDDADAQRTAG